MAQAKIRYSSVWEQYRVEINGAHTYEDDKQAAIDTAIALDATEIKHVKATPKQNENW